MSSGSSPSQMRSRSSIRFLHEGGLLGLKFDLSDQGFDESRRQVVFVSDLLQIVDSVAFALFFLVQVLDEDGHGRVDVGQNDATEDLREDREDPRSLFPTSLVWSEPAYLRSPP